MTDVVSLAQALNAQPSITGAEAPAVELAAAWLREHGWSVTLQEVSPARANIWASRGSGAVTLSTHLDTVPPFVAPARTATCLAGRGACDAKGSAAAMIVAAQRLASEGEVRVAEVRNVLERWSSGRAEIEFSPHIPAQHFHTDLHDAVRTHMRLVHTLLAS